MVRQEVFQVIVGDSEELLNESGYHSHYQGT
jgi:hypothetical protein